MKLQDHEKFMRKQRPEVFCKKGVLRHFAKFTGKHLCQSLFNKVACLRLFYRTPLVAASVYDILWFSSCRISSIRTDKNVFNRLPCETFSITYLIKIMKDAYNYNVYITITAWKVSSSYLFLVSENVKK